MKNKIFFVEDFGAVGDGITDDGNAIFRAISTACNNSDEFSEVRFKENATYSVETLPMDCDTKAIFSISNSKNMLISGCNTRLMIKAPIRVANILNSENVEVKGFIIDYNPSPFVLGRVTECNVDDCFIDVEADSDVNLPKPYTEVSDPYFAFTNEIDRRYHYFMTAYEFLGDKNRYRLHIAKSVQERIKKLHIDDMLILPFYGVSHGYGSSFVISGNKEFRFTDIVINSMPEFGFDVRHNVGNGYFTNIRFEPIKECGVNLVSWRDGFHVKDNVKPIIWDRCHIGPLGDDAFNLSCVYLIATSISQDKTELHLIPAESGLTRDIIVGDEFVAYDIETCSYHGEGIVSKVFSSDNDVHIKLDKPLPDFKEGMQISIYRFANEGYVIKNSYIEGTVRARGSGTFENNEFNVFWVNVENEFFVEGPVPKDITFKNCTFTTPYKKHDSIIFPVGPLGKNASTDCEYKNKNIALENCRFLKGQYEVLEGSELLIK